LNILKNFSFIALVCCGSIYAIAIIMCFANNIKGKLKQRYFMKVLFMGTPDYALVILKKLFNNFDIVGVYTQPDKPVGRKKTLTPPPVKVFANENNIPVYQPNNLKNEFDNINDLNPDYIVVAAFGQLLPKDILEISPCINLHASVLPKYRGASPIQSVILSEDKYTGVTAMKMDEGLDSGDILGIKYTKIDNKNSPELFEELAIIAADLTIDVLNNYTNIKPIVQNRSISTHCKKIKKDDGKVDFYNAVDINKKFRAFFYWPSIFTESFKIKNLELNSCNGNFNAGEILEINKEYVIIGCKKGSLKLLSIQPNSKKEMKAYDYVNGKRFKIGDIIS
jgi:methionyl-tRNA formyltransferase